MILSSFALESIVVIGTSEGLVLEEPIEVLVFVCCRPPEPPLVVEVVRFSRGSGTVWTPGDHRCGNSTYAFNT